MKKINLLIISLVLSLGLFTACSSPEEANIVINKEPISTTVKEQDIKELAYNQLTSEDKKRVSETWKDSKLSKITLHERMGRINNISYIGKEVYLIDFPTKGNSMPSNMIVYLAIDNNKLIGYGYVD
jgi:hypothetical protein